jgi:hypothetical protein
MASLLACAGAAALLLPLASVSSQVSATATSAQPMEYFEADIDLGEDYGTVPVVELIGYYLENPPEVPEGSALAVERKRHFGGC